jgi:hypothetical protein
MLYIEPQTNSTVANVYIKRSKNHIETQANSANIQATFPYNTNG